MVETGNLGLLYVIGIICLCTGLICVFIMLCRKGAKGIRAVILLLLLFLVAVSLVISRLCLEQLTLAKSLGYPMSFSDLREDTQLEVLTRAGGRDLFIGIAEGGQPDVRLVRGCPKELKPGMRFKVHNKVPIIEKIIREAPKANI